jgi:hypothetical protein
MNPSNSKSGGDGDEKNTIIKFRLSDLQPRDKSSRPGEPSGFQSGKPAQPEIEGNLMEEGEDEYDDDEDDDGVEDDDLGDEDVSGLSLEDEDDEEIVLSEQKDDESEGNSKQIGRGGSGVVGKEKGGDGAEGKPKEGGDGGGQHEPESEKKEEPEKPMPYWKYRWKNAGKNAGASGLVEKELSEEEKMKLVLESSKRFHDRFRMVKGRVSQEVRRMDSSRMSRRVALEQSNSSFPSHTIPLYLQEERSSGKHVVNLYGDGNNCLTVHHSKLSDFIEMNVRNEGVTFFTENTPRIGMYTGRRFRGRRRRKFAEVVEHSHAGNATGAGNAQRM